jgi:hypothetical protein
VWAKLPEPGEPPPVLQPAGPTAAAAGPTAAAAGPENQLPSRLALELPDGRYLLAYRRFEATKDDA